MGKLYPGKTTWSRRLLLPKNLKLRTRFMVSFGVPKPTKHFVVLWILQQPLWIDESLNVLLFDDSLKRLTFRFLLSSAFIHISKLTKCCQKITILDFIIGKNKDDNYEVLLQNVVSSHSHILLLVWQMMTAKTEEGRENMTPPNKWALVSANICNCVNVEYRGVTSYI